MISYRIAYVNIMCYYAYVMKHLRARHDFKPGDRLRLNTIRHDRDKPSDDGIEAPLTEAVVLGFHPSAFRSLGLPKIPGRRPDPNHWHIMVQDPETEEWLPAAIRDTNAMVIQHIHREHLKAAQNGDLLQYTIEELAGRVGAIASSVTSIHKIED